MIEKKIRRFELDLDEALGMVRNYLYEHCGLAEPVTMIKTVMDTSKGMIVEVYVGAVEVEVKE